MRELKGWHVLVMILAFFGVTIGVNTIFVSYALSTFAGEDVKQPYQKGLEYNDKLASRQAQAALGWQATIAARREKNGESVFVVRLVNAENQPLSALDVDLQLRHPANAYLDRSLKLMPLGDGVYEARVAGLKRGQWDVMASTQSSEKVAFQATRRVVLP
jgi:nitrogen fixation protein FixH